MDLRLLLKNEKLQEMVRFGITGMVSTVVTYLIYYLCLRWMSPSLAFSCGYLVAFIVNYIMTVRFTFKVKASAKNGLGFVVSNIINYGLSVGFLNVALWMGISKEIAPVPTMLLAAVCNFFIVRFVMRRF